MARRKEIEWLLNELPVLTTKGILPPETADRLRQYYGEDAREQRSWLTIVLSAIGALLIGGGLISLLAYNWEDFSRPVRAMLAFAPLIAGQIGAMRVLTRNGEGGVGAREGWGTFLFLAVGACLGLVAQTYHMGGRFDTFLLVWMWLGLPLALVMQAALPAVLAIAGFTAWAFMWEARGGSGLWVWPLGLVATAAAWPVLRDEKQAPRAAIITAASSLWLWCATGLTIGRLGIEDELPSLIYPVGLGVGASMYVFGEIARGTCWARTVAPVHRLGALLALSLVMSLTFQSLWRELDLMSIPSVVRGVAHMAPTEMWSIGVLLSAIVAVLAMAYTVAVLRKRWGAFWLGSAPLVYCLAVAAGVAWAGVAMMNAYALAAGVAGVVLGVRERNPIRAYSGLAVVMLLIGFRFFDAEIGFVERGIVFIALGIIFMAAQRVLARHMREAP